MPLSHSQFSISFAYMVPEYWHFSYVKQKLQQNAVDIHIKVTQWHKSLCKKYGGKPVRAKEGFLLKN